MCAVPRKILRIVTRLNVGGPSIQAIRLTTDLPPAGYATTLVHGRLGVGEGDMRELISRTDADVRYLHALGRPIRPLPARRRTRARRPPPPHSQRERGRRGPVPSCLFRKGRVRGSTRGG